MSVLRHGIVGAGFGIDGHLPAFAGLDGIEVVGVADNGSGRAGQAVASIVPEFRDWRHMLDRVQPDSLSVVTPPNSQREIVEEALGRGIHVLCEKPFGAGVEEAARMEAAARDAGCVAAVGFQFRFEPGIQELRRRVVLGAVGLLRRIDVAWLTAGRADSNRPWSWQHDADQGGGVVNAFFTHVADFLTWIARDRISSIAGSALVLIPERPDNEGSLRQVTAEDSVDVLVQFGGSVVGSARVSNCQPGGPGLRVEVFGEDGLLMFSHKPPFGADDAMLWWQVADRAPERLSLAGASGARLDSRITSVRRLADLFVHAIRGHEVPELPTFEDGLAVQRVIAVLRRAMEGRRFLDVSSPAGQLSL